MFAGFLLAGLVLWSVSSGDIRYGLPVEVAGGILVVGFVAAALRSRRESNWLMWSAAGLTLVLLAVQVVFAAAHLRSHNEYFTQKSSYDQISQPIVFSQPARYWHEARQILRDRDPGAYIDASTREKLARVDVWINGIDATSGVEAIARPGVPIISLGHFIDLFDLMDQDAWRNELARMLEANGRKRMFTLVQAPDLDRARRLMQRAGLLITSTEPIAIPFYSTERKLDFLLLEVRYDSRR